MLTVAHRCLSEEYACLLLLIDCLGEENACLHLLIDVLVKRMRAYCCS